MEKFSLLWDGMEPLDGGNSCKANEQKRGNKSNIVKILNAYSRGQVFWKIIAQLGLSKNVISYKMSLVV